MELLTVTGERVGSSEYKTKAEFWVSLCIPQPI